MPSVMVKSLDGHKAETFYANAKELQEALTLVPILMADREK